MVVAFSTHSGNWAGTEPGKRFGNCEHPHSVGIVAHYASLQSSVYTRDNNIVI